MNHTPGPFKIEKVEEDGQMTGAFVVSEADVCIARIMGGGRFLLSAKEIRANMEFVVQALNSYDELLEACKAASKWFHKDSCEHEDGAEDSECLNCILNVAIAKAEGGKS